MHGFRGEKASRIKIVQYFTHCESLQTNLNSINRRECDEMKFEQHARC